MAIVRPFKAIRPNEELVEKVISLPYDVMNKEEAAEMAKDNPYSFLHISRSEIDLPKIENQYDKKVYEKAKDNIDEFLKKGTLIQEESPVFYVYKQTMNNETQVGITACVSLDEYINNTIKKHEHTRVEKEKDRINHFDICNANTEPVFLTYRDDLEINKIMEDVMKKNSPIYDLTTVDGIGHTLYRIDENSLIEKIQELFLSIPSLYIADGHHRSASACKVGLKRRKENPEYTGEEEFNFFMAVIFPGSQLKIFDYNRVVSDLNGNTEEEFIEKVKKSGFEVEKLGEKGEYPLTKHTFTMALGDFWYRLTANQQIIPEHITGSLDVSILQENILNPILGIKDPRTDKRIDFIGGIRGLGELKTRINKDMKVAFAIYPVEIEDLLKVSDNDMVMPPKSTWFEPKLGSGLFVHQL